MLVRFICIIFYISICSCSIYKAYSYTTPEPKLSPVEAQAHFYQGIILEDEESWEQAVQHFDKASSLDPESPRIYLHLGKCLFQLKMLRQGLQHLEKAKQYAEPKDYLLWFDIGEVYHSAEMYLAAKMCYEKAIVSFPKFEKAHQALSQLQKLSSTGSVR